MRKSAVQVNHQVYETLDYLDKSRWISLWHQINEVMSKKPKKILEIGVGNGLVRHVFALLGQSIKTVDIDPQLRPDYVADARKLPFANSRFDVVLCAQVLEHMPFSDFPKALKELQRICGRYVILTLPHDYLTYFMMHFKLIPFIEPIRLLVTLPRWQTHEFNGQHYWEIGKKGYSLNKICKEITRAKFVIEKSYCLPENPYHRFFVLKKISKYD